MSLDFTKVGAPLRNAGPLSKARAKKPRKNLKKEPPEKGDTKMHMLSQRIQGRHNFNKVAAPIPMLMRAGKWLTGLVKHTRNPAGKTLREGFFSSPGRAFLGTQASRAAPMSSRMRKGIGLTTAPVSIGISSMFYPWFKPSSRTNLMQPMPQF